MRRICLYIIFFSLIFFALAQSPGLNSVKETSVTVVEENDSTYIFTDSTLISTDTLILPSDSVEIENSETDSLSTLLDSIHGDRNILSRISREKTDLEDAVIFSANDSLILKGENMAWLYGNSTVEYQTFKLNSAEIRMQLDSATVYANGVVDSTGNLSSTPVFQEGSDQYESKTMKYNFKTQRGYITDVITQQGEGYLTGGRTKRMENGTFYLENGKYTTCDDHEHPHFYFQLTKGRLRPNKDVVSGPVYMVLADVPLPIALPFGYFPFSKKYSSGIIFPSFGEDYNKGFYLRNGGYYFAINDYVDLALRGELYTKGSWGLSGRSTYVKRYKFRGNIDISYINTVLGDKGAPDYSRQNNFQVLWSHSQDAKANPNMSFSASVNFTTSGYSRNDLNSYYNSSFTENTKSSTISLSYRFPGSKWSMAGTANIIQRTQDSTVAVSFPNLTVSMSQTTPFKRKRSVGGERWYEKIRISYQGQFQNSLTSQQDQFFQKSLIRDWRNGLRHYVPISATFSLFKYFNISPSVTLNDRMYTSKVRRQWNPDASAEQLDTVYGFYNLFDFNASLSLDTKLYGFWKPMRFLGDKVQMIRHVLTPSISFTYTPDFSDPFWGIYGKYDYVDANGIPQNRVYSYFPNGIFGSPSSGMQGVISVNLANNLEMKVKSDKDSTGYKKISLIENLSVGQSYNLAADSLNWSNINTSIMLRLVKNFNLSLSATWDPYTYALSPSGTPVRVNKTRWQVHKGWAKLVSTGTSFSYTFNNDTFKRKNKDNTQTSEPENSEDEPQDESFAEQAARRREKKNENETTESSDADGYEKWACPWSLTLNYSISYGRGEFDYKKMDYRGKFIQNLSLSANIRPTANWDFSLSASYDFERKKIAYMNCSISRDLHCFTMSCSFIPVGPYKSYNFHIAVKSSLLKDFKYDQRSSTNNIVQWY